MRRVGALGRNVDRGGVGRGSVGYDRRGVRGGVVRAQQLLGRDLNVVGVAHVFGAVTVGATHGLNDVVDADGLAHGGQVEMGKLVQDDPQHEAAGRRRRGADDLGSVIPDAHRFALNHAVLLEIFGPPDAAVATHAFNQSGGRWAVIESTRTLLGNPLQRRRKVGLDDPVSLLRNVAVLQKHGSRGG